MFIANLHTPVSPGSEQVADANPSAAELLNYGFCPPTRAGTLPLVPKKWYSTQSYPR